MRPLKFRAWDKANSRMILPPSPFSSQLGPHMLTMDGRCYIEGKLQDFAWMQFTGLADSEGVEIYEGDVVEILWPKAMEGKRYIVEWTHRGPKHLGGWEFVHPNHASYAGSGNGQSKVIGNIYENPDLLEGSSRGHA